MNHELVFVLISQLCVERYFVTQIRQRYLDAGLTIPLGPEWLTVSPDFFGSIEKACKHPLEARVTGTQCAVMLIQGENANKVIETLNGSCEVRTEGTVWHDFGEVYSSPIDPDAIKLLFPPSRGS